MQPKHIAIIGGGITGLGAAWLLHKSHQVTLFEKNAYIGGHTHTIEVETPDGATLAVDTGFIVYNERNYPNLVGLFNELDIPTRATDMSFAFSLNGGELEYAGSSLNTLFAQRSNLFSLRHWRLIQEILRFNHTAHQTLATLEAGTNPSMSLEEFLDKHHFSTDLREHYLLPMGAAIWSCPVETMLKFPATSFLRFFANHGLIDLQNRPQWRSVCGGSSAYVERLLQLMGKRLAHQPAAVRVERHPQGVTVFTQQEALPFDAVILACHADEALALLADPSPDEQHILGSFHYQPNQTYLHTDTRLMPKRSLVWSSWNYLATSQPQSRQQMTATYWMNHLQGLPKQTPYLVTLNPYELPLDEHIIAHMTYHHPIFDQAAIQAQTQLSRLQGQRHSWFCGSYSRYGFHEDALMSAVDVVSKGFGILPLWKQTQTMTPGTVSPLAVTGATAS